MSNERGIAGDATVTGHETRLMKQDAGALFAGARVAEAVPLAPLTTLRVGPVVRRLITCATEEQVVATLQQLDAEAKSGAGGAPLVFAGGSNLVIADGPTEMTAVRLANDGIAIDGNLVRA